MLKKVSLTWTNTLYFLAKHFVYHMVNTLYSYSKHFVYHRVNTLYS